jgi:hypothetical protein
MTPLVLALVLAASVWAAICVAAVGFGRAGARGAVRDDARALVRDWEMQLELLDVDARMVAALDPPADVRRAREIAAAS